MNRYALFICLLFSAAVFGQDSNYLKKHYLKTYNQALGYNDINASINALQNYIALDNNVAYKDTLSMLYFRAKSYVSALILAEEVTKAEPGNIMATGRAAECYDQLGDPKTAIDLYEKVVVKTKDPYSTYKLAVCQYQLKRVAECEASARAALADTSSARTGVLFTNDDGSQQAIPVNAASYNLLGVLKMEAKDYNGAKADFAKAVGLFPQFVGAKLNMEVCDKNLKGAAKTPVKTNTRPK